MNINKIIYSKCPHCKQHGISLFKTGYKYNPILTCKYCGKKFKVNRVLYLFVLLLWCIFLGISYRLKDQFWPNIPYWISWIYSVIPLLLFEYFAPLEEESDK